MDYIVWKNKALKAIEKVETNKKFELRDLFNGSEWNTLTIGDRINFGKYFANEVREGNIPNIAAIERGANNHSKYIKN